MMHSLRNGILVIKNAIDYWSKKDAPRRAAALSFYTIFSIGPLAVIIIALLQYVVASMDTATFIQTLSQFISPQALISIEKSILSFQAQPAHLGLIIISSIILAISAGAVIRELEQSLEQMLNPHYTYVSNFKKTLTRYGVALLGIILCTVILLLVISFQQVLSSTSLFQISALSSLSFFKLLSSIIIFIIITFLTAGLYRYLLRKNVQHVWKGSMITAFLVTIGQAGISQYLAWSDISSAFGAAGSLAIFLLWIYYSSLVFFFGVAIMHVLQGKSGEEN